VAGFLASFVPLDLLCAITPPENIFWSGEHVALKSQC
jgi:hypothetical protein